MNILASHTAYLTGFDAITSILIIPSKQGKRKGLGLRSHYWNRLNQKQVQAVEVFETDTFCVNGDYWFHVSDLPKLTVHMVADAFIGIDHTTLRGDIDHRLHGMKARLDLYPKVTTVANIIDINALYGEVECKNIYPCSSERSLSLV